MNRHRQTIRLTVVGSLGVLLLVAMVFSGLLKNLPSKKSVLLVGAASDLLGGPSEALSSKPLRYKRATLGKHRTPLRIPHLRAKTAKLCSVVADVTLELRSVLPANPDLAASSAGNRTTGARAPPFA